MGEVYPEEADKNLEIIDRASNFTNWMYGEIKPFLKGSILEIGSGRGTYSRKIFRDFKKKIYLTDIDPKYVKSLKKEFKAKSVEVLQLDITKEKDFDKIRNKIDSAFALNVVEHVEQDVKALKNIHSSLRKGGVFIMLVPAHKFLFNCIDESVDHYRRYTSKELKEKVAKTDFKIKKMFFFNFISIFGWYYMGNIRKKTLLDEGTMGFFNKIVPLMKVFEKYILRKRMGISLIAVLEK